MKLQISLFKALTQHLRTKSYGVDKFLKEIKQEVEQGNYYPKSVRRTFIPKKDGKMRFLGITHYQR